jgi:glucose/arabinose dehydrogenase
MQKHIVGALTCVLLVGCRGDGRSPERSNVGAPSEEGPAPATGSAPAPTPTEPPAPTTVTEPPGSDKVGAVPKDIGAKVKLERIATGLARPVLAIVAPGDARKRIFVLEQHTGRIKIIEGGKVLPQPFATIGPVSKANEQGLLGLAFSPRFQTDGKLYINYTDANDATRIVEFAVSKTNPDAIDMASRREIAKIGQPYSNHNGGHLEFGPDGKLYTGMGDGGSAGDPEENGQNPKALLAKMLRYDVSKDKPEAEIVHMGVRNPWRFSFDAKTGDLYIGDVGQNLWEYVFVAAKDSAAKNFGWNVIEGKHCYRAKQCDKSKYTLPVIDYAHREGCSITGGIVYRGKALPALDGRYFYADFCTNFVRSFVWTHDPSSATAPGWARDHWEWNEALDPKGEITQISSFGTDHDGELFVISLDGKIWKLVPAA